MGRCDCEVHVVSRQWSRAPRSRPPGTARRNCRPQRPSARLSMVTLTSMDALAEVLLEGDRRVPAVSVEGSAPLSGMRFVASRGQAFRELRHRPGVEVTRGPEPCWSQPGPTATTASTRRPTPATSPANWPDVLSRFFTHLEKSPLRLLPILGLGTVGAGQRRSQFVPLSYPNWPSRYWQNTLGSFPAAR